MGHEGDFEWSLLAEVVSVINGFRGTGIWPFMHSPMSHSGQCHVHHSRFRGWPMMDDPTTDAWPLLKPHAIGHFGRVVSKTRTGSQGPQRRGPMVTVLTTSPGTWQPNTHISDSSDSNDDICEAPESMILTMHYSNTVWCAFAAKLKMKQYCVSLTVLYSCVLQLSCGKIHKETSKMWLIYKHNWFEIIMNTDISVVQQVFHQVIDNALHHLLTQG